MNRLNGQAYFLKAISERVLNKNEIETTLENRKYSFKEVREGIILFDFNVNIKTK